MNIHSNRRSAGVAMLMLAAILFGLIPIVVKLAYATGMSMLEVLLVRSIIASLVALVVLAVRRQSLRIPPGQRGAVFGASALYTMTMVTLYSSYYTISSGAATSIHYLYPLFVVIIVIIHYRERPSRRIWVTLAIGIIGVFLTADPFGMAFSPSGVAFAACSAVFFAFYVVLIGTKRMAGMDSLVLTLAICVVTALFAIVALLATGRSAAILSMPLDGILYSAIVGVFCTVIPVVLFIQGTKIIGATEASILSTLEPVVALIAGVLVLGEAPMWYMVLGCVLIVIATIIVAGTRKMSDNGA